MRDTPSINRRRGPFGLLVIGLACATTCARQSPESRSAPLTVDSCRGVADGALCNDQNPCTLEDKCAAGLCMGVMALDGTLCTDNDQCTATDQCVRGTCKGTPVAEGTLCTDGDPCSDPDTCRLGKCVPGPAISCDDRDTCTIDRCVEGDGCQHMPIPACSDASTVADGGPDADALSPSDAADADALGADDAGSDADAALPDAVPVDAVPEVAAGDAQADASPDALLDATAPDAVADAASEAPDDGGVESGDAGGGAEAAPVYEARGGACACSSSSVPGPGTGAGVGLALTLLFLRGKRRARPTIDRAAGAQVGMLRASPAAGRRGPPLKGYCQEPMLPRQAMDTKQREPRRKAWS